MTTQVETYEPRIREAMAAAAFHGLTIDAEEADWLIWNRTAYPFCSHTHMICQLSEHFRSITTKGG